MPLCVVERSHAIGSQDSVSKVRAPTVCGLCPSLTWIHRASSRLALRDIPDVEYDGRCTGPELRRLDVTRQWQFVTSCGGPSDVAPLLRRPADSSPLALNVHTGRRRHLSEGNWMNRTIKLVQTSNLGIVSRRMPISLSMPR